ncbi:MAG: DUF1707 domain-containing protein [Streptosporangiaceae bacterium]|jgi:hypothetical protein
MATGFNVRVGDADRDAVTAQLREHYADGRLTLEELNERLDQAFAAKTKADLNTVMRDLPQATRPAADMPYGGTAWQGPAWPGPMATKPGQDYGNGGWGGSQGNQRRCGQRNAFAPLMGLVWLVLILGSVFLFGLGGGERPLAIILFFAALALVKRLFGFGRRRGYGGPRGSRGPRGRRR